MYKTQIKARNQEKNPSLYIKLSHQLKIKNLNLKVDHHTGGSWPQTLQGESVAKPRTPAPDDYP